MKVSDPIIFGHCVSVFYGPVLEKHAVALESIGFEPNNGIGDLYAKLDEFIFYVLCRLPVTIVAVTSSTKAF